MSNIIAQVNKLQDIKNKLIQVLQANNVEVSSSDSFYTLVEKAKDAKEYVEVIKEVIVEVGSSEEINKFLARTQEAIVNLDYEGAIGDHCFYDYKSLLTARFDKATSLGVGAFELCTALTSVSLPLATNIGSRAFYGCTALTSVNLPLVTSIGDISFYQCSALTSINLPLLTSIGGSTFYECKNLTSIYMPLVTIIAPYAFEKCEKLTEIVLPSVESISTTAFRYCYLLNTVDLPIIKSIDTYVFTKSCSLKALILRKNVVCTLKNINSFIDCYHYYGKVDSTYNPNGDKDGYIYVPRDLVDSYKTATNWSTLADQFRALEDYTVDGTTTGELDPTKI